MRVVPVVVASMVYNSARTGAPPGSVATELGAHGWFGKRLILEGSVLESIVKISNQHYDQY